MREFVLGRGSSEEVVVFWRWRGGGFAVAKFLVGGRGEGTVSHVCWSTGCW